MVAWYIDSNYTSIVRIHPTSKPPSLQLFPPNSIQHLPEFFQLSLKQIAEKRFVETTTQASFIIFLDVLLALMLDYFDLEEYLYPILLLTF